MIAASLAKIDPNRSFLLERNETDDRDIDLTYGQCRDAVDRLVAEHGRLRGCRVGLRARGDVETALWLFALDTLHATPYLMPPNITDEAQAVLTTTLGLNAMISGRAITFAAAAHTKSEQPSEVVLFTSGTTGVPKAVRHTWESLTARVHRSPALADARWLFAYPLSAFAGVQVLLHALLNGGSVVFGASNPATATRALIAGVSHISATPTYFRMLLMSGATASADPKHLTLGGEAVDQAVLDRLRSRFADATITHIYASSEMGACFSVHDGFAGFPTSYLESDQQPTWCTIRDGELFIRSPHAMRGYIDAAEPRDGTDLYPTGDLVEVVGERVKFLGRRNEGINVGGQKVHPREIEDVLLSEPLVQAARVWGKASSVTGQIVRAAVVVMPDVDRVALRRSLLERCRSQLAPFKVPRMLDIVDELAQTASGKLARR